MSRKSSRNLLGTSFIAHRREMKESPAWFALPDGARRLLDRLEIEHMRHGGAENGQLICPYGAFELYGIRKASIPLAIAQCETLGFLEVQKFSFTKICRQRAPNRYRLTYLDGANKTHPRTDEWAKIEHADEAERRLSEVLAKYGDKRRTQAKEHTPPENIDSRRAGVPRLLARPRVQDPRSR